MSRSDDGSIEFNSNIDGDVEKLVNIGHVDRLYLGFDSSYTMVPTSAPRSDDHLETEAPAESRKFSDPIRQHMDSLNIHIEELTQDQFRVIQMLRENRRVRIKGCAGSGKTLVAAEKAIRLSADHFKTLFLCHNPLLARHVAGLVRGSTVAVVDFSSWVRSLPGTASAKVLEPECSGEDWTHYEEPDEAAMAEARAVLTHMDAKFDAVIVDEGQDFRYEWWDLVEAALADPNYGILYIFHDDNQALLPHRSSYPNNYFSLDLSRNCRNGGKIYELIRCFYYDAPPPEEDLAGKGKVRIIPFKHGCEYEAMADAIGEITPDDKEHFPVLLHAGDHDLHNCTLCGAKVPLREYGSWQDGIRLQFKIVIRDPRDLRIPDAGEIWVLDRLGELSHEPFPTLADVELVKRIARGFTVKNDLRRRINDIPFFRKGLLWFLQDGRFHLRRRKPEPNIWPVERIMHLERDDWTVGLPHPDFVTLRPYFDAVSSERVIRMYGIEAFKGLEADVVILLIHGSMDMHRTAFYVGISRARCTLVILADEQACRLLPDEWLR